MVYIEVSNGSSHPVQKNEAHGSIRTEPIGPLTGQWVELSQTLYFFKACGRGPYTRQAWLAHDG